MFIFKEVSVYMCPFAFAEAVGSIQALNKTPSSNRVLPRFDVNPFKQPRLTQPLISNPIHDVKIVIIVDTKWVTALRQVIVKTFADIVSLIRIEPIDHAKKMKVCLHFDHTVEDNLMTTIMRNLPSAEFGRITRVQ